MTVYAPRVQRHKDSGFPSPQDLPKPLDPRVPGKMALHPKVGVDSSKDRWSGFCVNPIRIGRSITATGARHTYPSATAYGWLRPALRHRLLAREMHRSSETDFTRAMNEDAKAIAKGSAVGRKSKALEGPARRQFPGRQGNFRRACRPGRGWPPGNEVTHRASSMPSRG